MTEEEADEIGENNRRSNPGLQLYETHHRVCELTSEMEKVQRKLDHILLLVKNPGLGLPKVKVHTYFKEE